MGDFTTSSLAKAAGIKPQSVRRHLCRGKLKAGNRRGPHGAKIIPESAANRWLALHYPHKTLNPVREAGNGQSGPVWKVPAISSTEDYAHLVFAGGKTACNSTARAWKPFTDGGKCKRCLGAEKVLRLLTASPPA